MKKIIKLSELGLIGAKALEERARLEPVAGLAHQVFKEKLSEYEEAYDDLQVANNFLEDLIGKHKPTEDSLNNAIRTMLEAEKKLQEKEEILEASFNTAMMTQAILDSLTEIIDEAIAPDQEGVNNVDLPHYYR